MPRKVQTPNKEVTKFIESTVKKLNEFGSTLNSIQTIADSLDESIGELRDRVDKLEKKEDEDHEEGIPSVVVAYPNEYSYEEEPMFLAQNDNGRLYWTYNINNTSEVIEFINQADANSSARIVSAPEDYLEPTIMSYQSYLNMEED